MQNSPFELRILGPTEIRGSSPEADDANVRPPKRLALLAYLALETADGFRRRDQIVGLFWPELPQEAARTQLRKAIHAFRESIGAEAIESRGEGELRINSNLLWCDAVALEQHVRSERWAEALPLFRGDLLEGLHAEGTSQELEEWLREKRKTLRTHAAAAAWECSRNEEGRGDRKAAAVMARRALDLTPDDEAGVRRLIELLDRHGDRGGALRVYAEWKARLQNEFGVEPAPETRKLVRRVEAARKGESHETPPVSAPISAASLHSQSFTAPISPSRSTRRSSRRTIQWAGALLLAVIAIVAFQLYRRVPPPPAKSIAVLGMRPNGDPSLTAVGKSFTDEFTDRLIAQTDLVVRPPMPGAAPNTDDIGGTGLLLNVTFVIDSRVERSGGQDRIGLRMIHSADGVAVWAGQYTLSEDSIAVVASRAAIDAASALRSRAVPSR